MKIKIKLKEPKEGTFAGIWIYFIYKGLRQKAFLKIKFEDLYDFSKETLSTSFDFFLISSVIYGIDNILNRHTYSLDGWTRDISVNIPVRNPIVWSNIKYDFEECLSFLTGDYWNIDFTEIPLTDLFLQRNHRKKINVYDNSKYYFCSLFSGGLDSLVGGIDLLENVPKGKKVMFVSHFDPNSVGPNNDQNILIKYLKQKYYNKLDWVQARIYLKKDKEYLSSWESSYRSRSILFLGIASYILNAIPNNSELIVPENGTISLNYPLTPSRSSSLSTRTTHPFFIKKLNEILKKIGSDVIIKNPYAKKTKGEMVFECANRHNLSEIYTSSVSCGKRGRRKEWKNPSNTNHCGTCIPCFYRRAGLHKLGWDNQLYGNNIFISNDPLHYRDFFGLSDYLKKKLNKDTIKRDLLINSSLMIDDLDEYAELILRSRKELRKWIKDKGNETIRNIIGLK